MHQSIVGWIIGVTTINKWTAYVALTMKLYVNSECINPKRIDRLLWNVKNGLAQEQIDKMLSMAINQFYFPTLRF